MLRAKGPQQWPYPALGHSSARRYEDGHFPTPTGRARFFARPWTAPTASMSAADAFPLTLTTGRVPGQWHTRTKTGLVEELNKLDPAPYIDMHPSDAQTLDLHNGQFVEVASPRGCASGVLRVVDSTPAGTVFMPMHWNDQWAHR